MNRAARLGLIAVLMILVSAAAASPSFAGKSVYLMRGLMDVSTGLDDLAAKLKRRGMTAVVKSYTDEAELTEAALRGYKSGTGCPIVIIGHSLGADAAVRMVIAHPAWGRLAAAPPGPTGPAEAKRMRAGKVRSSVALAAPAASGRLVPLTQTVSNDRSSVKGTAACAGPAFGSARSRTRSA